MYKKTILLLSLCFYNHMIVPSLTEKDQLIDSTADQIYALLKERTNIRNQLVKVYEKLPNKNIPDKETFSLGYVIGSTILTGLIASPAFTINYLNKYITPEKYQSAVDKISLGAASLIGGIGGFKVAKQGTKSVYDWFWYESIRKKIKELEDNLSKTTGSINGIMRKKDFDLYDIFKIDKHELTSKTFVDFYEKNNQIITKEKMSIFLFQDAHITPQPDNILMVLNACRNVRNKLILSVEDFDSKSRGTWSTGNLSHDIILGIGMILLSPWAILASATDDKKATISSPYQAYRDRNEWEYEKYKKIDELNAIIQQLKIILFEITNEPLTTSP